MKKEFIQKMKKYSSEEAIEVETNKDIYMIENNEGVYISELLGDVIYKELSDISFDIYFYITEELRESIQEIDIL